MQYLRYRQVGLPDHEQSGGIVGGGIQCPGQEPEKFWNRSPEGAEAMLQLRAGAAERG